MIAVNSDSAAPSPAEGPPESASQYHPTKDFTPDTSDAPSTKSDVAGPSRDVRPLPRTERPGRRGFRNGLPLPRRSARPARGRQGPPRRDRGVARRGGAISPGSPQARAAQPSRHRGGPRRWLGGRAGFIVSDFLEGPDLGQWLDGKRPSWQEAARIVAAVADALAHAHARLIVHRDVKPANIIITPDRGPVLVDFGLGLDEAGAGGSQLGLISGTPAYMAPNKSRARRTESTVAPTSTVWAWCFTRCSAATCLSGRVIPASCSGK